MFELPRLELTQLPRELLNCHVVLLGPDDTCQGLIERNGISFLNLADVEIRQVLHFEAGVVADLQPVLVL